MKGKVWLVGAGPGDPGLLTVKGREVLEQAQVVVYDRLVGEGILNLIPQQAEIIDVGKRASNHTMPQEKSNQVLLEKALEGKRVVRLKGGDPFVFGRGGEELALLAERGVPYEVVPGVTSAFAVPAYAGIPVTHRDFASSVHVITGHKKAGEKLQLDFKSLARLSGTLVFLMSVSAISQICQGLLEAGMKPETPAAALQQGTGAAQKKIITDLEHLPAKVQEQGVHSPAIFMVGSVCALGNEFGWYEKLPLFGRKILVTRPRERSGTLSRRLRELGAEVLELPAIRTELLENSQRLIEELERLAEYQYLVFTSPAGVNLFFDELKRQGKDIRSLGSAQIAAIGKGTRKELEDRGLICALMPEIYDGKHLGILLGESCQTGDKILIPRAERGNAQLIEEIEKRVSVNITDLPVYRTVYEKPNELIDEKKQIENGQIRMAVFTSVSTVRGFAAAVEGLDYSLVHAVCIGAQTEAAAKKLGMQTETAKKADLDSLVEACVSMAQHLNIQEADDIWN
ncbi:uroporphyrinogen-III C-methyltransferase [Lachnospiraceae bacterium 45-W7]